MKTCPVCSTQYPDDVRFCPNDGQTLRSSSPGQDLVGQVVADRYHVLKKLGEGGMGQVYLAEHVKMGRKSAIKVLNPTMVYDPDAVARFNREAANASRISHPSVCAVYDFGETPEGLIYLAMEFVEGEPLTDVLEREGALPVTRAVHLFAQVADALQAAHELGIVHRDLKPDNIMLARGRDGSDVVKVVDFGIAKAVSGVDSQNVTKTGLVLGTPEFMSPEQLAGDKVDGRSDIYSLALVLFKMLTGKLPFEAATVQEAMIKRLTDQPLRLSAARPDLRFPPGLQETLDSALARSPVERYQSAAKFASDVASVTGLTRASSGTPMPVTWGDAEERTKLLRSLSAAALEMPTTLPAPKPRSLIPVLVSALVILGAGGAAWVVWGGGRGRSDLAPLDTAQSVEAPRPTDRGVPPQPGSREPVPPAPRPPRRDATPPRRVFPPPVSDSIARRRIEAMILDLADGKVPAGARESAETYYAMSELRSTLRAAAARIVAETYIVDDDRANALLWANNALQLDPGNQTYQNLVKVLKGESPH